MGKCETIIFKKRGELKDFIPKVSAIDSYDNPSFMIGELSEKSGEAPEKIVEKNYNMKLNSSGNFKNISYKQNREFKNSMGRTVISTTQTLNGFSVYGTCFSGCSGKNEGKTDIKVTSAPTSQSSSEVNKP